MLSQSRSHPGLHAVGSSPAHSRQPARLLPHTWTVEANARILPHLQAGPETALRTACRASASSNKGFADTSKSGAARQKSGAAKGPTANTICPCGSTRMYKDCCGPCHRGAMARSAVDLAMARFSAASIGLPQFLVDTTHPDSLAMMGSSRHLLRRMESVCKQFQLLRFRMSDMCAGVRKDEGHKARGEEQEGGEDWLLVLVIDGTTPGDGSQGQVLTIERYVKHGGQWMFFSEDKSLPDTEPFLSFAKRHKEYFT